MLLFRSKHAERFQGAHVIPLDLDLGCYGVVPSRLVVPRKSPRSLLRFVEVNMGWGYGVIGGREVGYTVDAICDHPGCDVEIDRGLGFACGGSPGATHASCELHFCADHLIGVELCAECRNDELADCLSVCWSCARLLTTECQGCQRENEGIVDMQKEEIERRFTYHPPKEGQPKKYAALRDKAQELAFLIDELVPEGREQSLAFTKLEEAVMHANSGIARRS